MNKDKKTNKKSLLNIHARVVLTTIPLLIITLLYGAHEVVVDHSLKRLEWISASIGSLAVIWYIIYSGLYKDRIFTMLCFFMFYGFMFGAIFYNSFFILNYIIPASNDITIQGNIYGKEYIKSTSGRGWIRHYYYMFIEDEKYKKYKVKVTAPHYESFEIGDTYRVDDWKKGLLGITYRSRWSDRINFKE